MRLGELLRKGFGLLLMSFGISVTKKPKPTEEEKAKPE